MHQIQKDKFHVISPEAFSPKPLNEVQKRLQAILDYWGPKGERWHGGECYDGVAGEKRCAVRVLDMLKVPHGSATFAYLTDAAHEQGFYPSEEPRLSATAVCSDSSFENARKMVLRAIALAGEP